MSTSTRYASFWQRLWAFIIDIIIYYLGGWLFLIPLSGLYKSYASFVIDYTHSLQNYTTQENLFTILIGLWFVFLLAVAPILIWQFGYSIPFITWKGQTPGMMITKIKVTNENGSKVRFGTAFMREFVGKSIVFLFVFPLGFLWVLLDKKAQGWHDKIAGTLVVQSR